MTTKAKETPRPDEDTQDAVSLFAQYAAADSHQDSPSDSDSDSDNASDEDERLDQDDSDQSDEEDEDDTGDDDDDASDEAGDDDADTNESSDDDPWETAPESLRNEYMSLRQRHEKLEHEHRSNSGRVAALNRELNTLRTNMKQAEQQRGKPEGNPNQPTADDLKDKTFAQVKQEWPELATYLEHMVQQTNAQIDQKLTPVEQLKRQLDEEREQQSRHAEYERLAQAHPDFQTVANDPNFQHWVNTQPPGVQAMFNSSSADDNIVLLNLYKGTQAASQPSGQQKRKPAPAKKPLSDHAEIPRKGAGRALADSESTDPAELFYQLASKKS